MDSSPIAEVAARLGVPRSRVLRWCREGTIDAHKDDRGRWLTGHDVMEGLVGQWGAVPEPHPTGFRRHELLALAALVVAPRGLPSVRAVAARTGLAPTTASRVLNELHDRGLVERRAENRLMRGHARPMHIWYAALLDPTIERLLPYLHTVVLPGTVKPRKDQLPSRLPTHLWHQVWNADPQSIDPRDHAEFLAHRALTTGDPEALAWAVTHLPAAAFDDALTKRGVPKKAAGWARAAHGLEATDVAAPHVLLDIPQVHAGLPVAGIRDLMADKLKAVGDRGELRDYYDLQAIETMTPHRVEQGLAYYQKRYGVGPDHVTLGHIVGALGYLDDVADDPGLPVDRATVENYWRRRQPEIAAHLQSLSYTHGLDDAPDQQ